MEFIGCRARRDDLPTIAGGLVKDTCKAAQIGVREVFGVLHGCGFGVPVEGER